MRNIRVQDFKSWAARKGLFIFVFFILFFVVCLLCPPVHAWELRSRGAIAMEAATGRVLFGKNPYLRFPPASTAKLMTAMVVLDTMKPEDTVVISRGAASVAPIKANFRAGERATVEALLNAALIKSANDAAYALAEAAAGSEEKFAEMMNRKASALGMSDTRFVNSTGLPGRGQYITAHDLAVMMRGALQYPLIRQIIGRKTNRISTEGGRELLVENSNKLLWSDDSVLGGKTGYTRAARHCFVCASEQGNDTVIVSLLGAPSRDTLWSESEELFGKGFSVMQGKEEPAFYFTNSGREARLQPASDGLKAAEAKKAPEAAGRKAAKQMRAVAMQAAKKSAKYARKVRIKASSAQRERSGGYRG